MKYDVFICHASEDKVDFVSGLAEALDQAGLSVWYDDFTLSLGASLTNSISQGITNSKFGIVVLSQSFIYKKWAQRELAALITRENEEGKVILPIWHKITKEEIISSFPLLADKLAVMSSVGMPKIIQKILNVVNPLAIAQKYYEEGLSFEKAKMRGEATDSYIRALRINNNNINALHRVVGLSGTKSVYDSGRKVKIGHISLYKFSSHFGFITCEDDDSDYFFITQPLTEKNNIEAGQKVAFFVKEGANGKKVAQLVGILSSQI